MGNMFRVLGCLLGCAWLMSAQVTITDTGSTNVPGMNVKLENSGPEATAEPRGGTPQKMTIPKDLCSRLMDDLKNAGPLNELPVAHCMKSVSFGTSLFIEYNGAKSPDLSCRQTDTRTAALKKDAMDIMALAKAHVPTSNKKY